MLKAKLPSNYSKAGGQDSESNFKMKLGAIALLGLLGLMTVYKFVWPQPSNSAPFHQNAYAVLRHPKGDTQVEGFIEFQQLNPGDSVSIRGTIGNLDANSKRGFHIHELGDLSNGCVSTGSHFNPFGKTHGAPSDRSRHVGDLGNISTNSSGIASVDFRDDIISLNGEVSIIGRAVVVHAGTDDLGRGDNEESHKTGNAGGRVACGVIGIKK